MPTVSRFAPLLVALALGSACGSGSGGAEAGQETGPCIDGDCFDGLMCLSDLCVGPDATPGSGTGAPSMPGGEASTSASGSTGSGPTPTAGAESDPADDDDDMTRGSSSGDDESDETASGPGPGRACDVWAQDCPAGYKCNPWADDGGDTWNAARCVELAPAAVELGQPCFVQGGPTSGEDDCQAGAMCWDVDEVTGVGTCAELCTGSDGAPECSGPRTCSVYFDGVVPLCLAACDPIAQNCPGGEVCYAYAGVLDCAPDGSGAGGELGDSCNGSGTCDPGLSCTLGSDLSDCTTFACCTPFCELDDDACPAGLTCTAYFPAGEEPPGFENLGWCVD